MFKPSSKTVQAVVFLLTFAVMGLLLMYGQRSAAAAAGGLGMLIYLTVSPRTERAKFFGGLAAICEAISRGFRQVEEHLDPDAHGGSCYRTEHFFDDQGIRIELHNLNCSRGARMRAGDFAAEFLTDMLHRAPQPETAAATPPDVRGDTKRYTEPANTAS